MDADGPQGRRPRDRGRGRRAGGARRTRWTTTGDDGLPGPGQGGRRRRRQGHAGRALRRRATTRRVAAATPRGAGRVRRRHHAGGEVRRARPAHRGAGAGRRPRQRRPPLRARLLDPAPAPEGARGGAGADDHRPRSGDAGHRFGGRPGAAGRLRERRHRGVPPRRGDRRGVLPGDEHPAPGRAPGDRAGVRSGQRLDLVELQLRVAAGEPLPFAPGRRAVDGPRDRGPGVRRGLVRRLPAAGRHRRAWCGGRRGRAGRPRARAAGRWSARRTTRCSAR